MLYFLKFLYETFLLPPGILIILLISLDLWLYRRNRRASLALLFIIFIFYISVTYWCGDGLIHSLECRYRPPLKITGDVLIVLGGGATFDTPNINGIGHLSGSAANRILTCAQLYRISNLPIIISGGRVYRSSGDESEIAKNTLMGLGVPQERIILENRALNTSENAKYIRKLLAQYKFRHPVLITSAFHMERSVRQFKKFKINVLPYPTDYQSNIHQKFEFYWLWPSAGALNKSHIALKEYLGIAVAKWY